jgi:hypothetical protein
MRTNEVATRHGQKEISKSIGSASVAVFFSTMMIVGCLIGIAWKMDAVKASVDKPSKPVVTLYEDHSGRIQFDGAVCVLPAFDSPEDRITCTVE